MGGRPSFGGIAIGDTLLENFDYARLRAWWDPGQSKNNRIQSGPDAYTQGNLLGVPVPNDVFSLQDYKNDRWYPWFSGTRTPSTSTEFGLFNTVPNGNSFKLPYELILITDNNSPDKEQNKDIKEGQREKRQKTNLGYAIGVGITKIDGVRSASKNKKVVNVGDIVELVIRREEKFTNYNGGRWGLEDVNTSTASRRYSADQALTLSKLYRIGTATLACIQEPNNVFEVKEETVTYKFRCVERGEIRFGNPVEDYLPYETYNLQEYGDGIITTNRPQDDYVEVGLKSTVWKRISGFPNVNSQPSASTIQQYEEGGGSITLGNMNTYIFRMSFFTIQIRPIDKSSWITLNPGTIFCIKNNTPSEVFNSFRIQFPDDAPEDTTEFEIRFRPLAGNYILDRFKNENVTILDSRKDWKAITVNSSRDGRYRLWYRGYKESLSIENTSNKEFIVGKGNAVGKNYQSPPWRQR